MSPVFFFFFCFVFLLFFFVCLFFFFVVFFFVTQHAKHFLFKATGNTWKVFRRFLFFFKG